MNLNAKSLTLDMKDIQTPPRTIMEVFKMLPEGTLAEVINKNLYMSPSPSTNHQWLVLELGSAIKDQLKSELLGKVFISPCDVFLDEESNAVQPDILVVSTGNLSIVRKDAIHGVPDLIIEVLSSNNQRYDLVTKKELYEKFGVKEYWVINPDTKESFGFFLKDGKYGDPEKYQAQVKSSLFNHDFHF